MKHLYLSILIVSISSLFLSINIVHAGLFNKESVLIYNLKNLESDLAKDLKYDKDCRNKGISCNAFALDDNNDALIRTFVQNLKASEKKKAADILNTIKIPKYGSHTHLFPITIGDYPSSMYGAIPFHHGIMGMMREGERLQFFYLTIHNNQFIRIVTDGGFLIDYSHLYPYNVDKVLMIGINAQYKEINRFSFAMSCRYSEQSGRKECDEKEAFRKYLFGITPNKAMDEWKKAFQKKIQSIKNFSKL